MQLSEDPFDESVCDLRALLAKLRGIRESIALKGLVNRSVVVEVKDVLQGAADDLRLLNNVLQIIDQRNGKIGAHVFSVNEVLHRQRIVRDLENELKDMYSFRDIIESRLEDMEAKARFTAANLDFDGNDNDDFLMNQEVTQREEHAHQDVLLDRLAYGLQELRETGVNVNDELQTQEVLLDEADRDVEGEAGNHDLLVFLMEEAVLLSATLRRASLISRRRLVTVLFVLAEQAKCGGAPLSLSSIVAVLQFVMPQKPARFLFAGGGNSSILRSHDRGHTWRLLHRTNPIEKGLNIGVDADQMNVSLDEDSTVESITQLLRVSTPKKDIGKKEIDSSCLDTQITHITTLNDMIAVCGGDSFLAVSADRGVTLKILEKDVLIPFLSDKKHSAESLCKIGGLTFLSESALLFYSEKILFLAGLHSSKFDSVLFENVKVIRVFDNAIGCLDAFSIECTSKREIYVSTLGFLHYSSNGGDSFLDFPHQLGVLRALWPLELSLRRAEIPNLPEELIKNMLSHDTKGGAKGVEPKTFLYTSIARGTSIEGDGDSGDNVERHGMCASVRGLPLSVANIRYHVFFVAGVGTPILPYDYTALLFVAASLFGTTSEPGVVGTMAKNVTYVPYLRSTPADPIHVAINRRPGTKLSVFARSNGAGVSFSKDGGKSWSLPTQAFTVALIAVDGGEFISCNTRNVVTTFIEDRSEGDMIPTSLRVPFLTDSAVML